MKNYRTILCLLGMSGIFLLGGCQKTEVPSETPTVSPTQSIESDTQESTQEGMILASHLTEEDSRMQLDAIMEEAGISKERRTVFWDHVEQFNQCEGITGLTNGYELISAKQPEYDVYDLQDAWYAQHPEFIGYNCRITAFSLLGDTITVANTEHPNKTNLFLDEQALWEDDSALFGEEELSKFLALFSMVEGENTNDAVRQAELVQQAWANRGITFEENSSKSLISVILHNQYSETENELIVGHTGVLFETGDGLYFVEKLAFQAPYQVVRFSNREELKEYLMAVYDVEWDQPTAPPILLENDQIM